MTTGEELRELFDDEKACVAAKQEYAERAHRRRRFVARVREVIVANLQLKSEHIGDFEALRSDIRQCERLLALPDPRLLMIDPVLEIWCAEGRYGVTLP